MGKIFKTPFFLSESQCYLSLAWKIISADISVVRGCVSIRACGLRVKNGKYCRAAKVGNLSLIESFVKLRSKGQKN